MDTQRKKKLSGIGVLTLVLVIGYLFVLNRFCGDCNSHGPYWAKHNRGHHIKHSMACRKDNLHSCHKKTICDHTGKDSLKKNAENNPTPSIIKLTETARVLLRRHCTNNTHEGKKVFFSIVATGYG